MLCYALLRFIRICDCVGRQQSLECWRTRSVQSSLLPIKTCSVIFSHKVSWTGVSKCPLLGILNITFKYLLDIISPILGWCWIGTFTNPWRITRLQPLTPAVHFSLLTLETGTSGSALTGAPLPGWGHTPCHPQRFTEASACEKKTQVIYIVKLNSQSTSKTSPFGPCYPANQRKKHKRQTFQT